MALKFDAVDVVRSAAQSFKEEGRREGRLDGRRQILQRLLEGRFGEIGPGHAGRLASASAAELDAWASRVLGAASLDQVFAD